MKLEKCPLCGGPLRAFGHTTAMQCCKCHFIWKQPGAKQILPLPYRLTRKERASCGTGVSKQPLLVDGKLTDYVVDILTKLASLEDLEDQIGGPLIDFVELNTAKYPKYRGGDYLCPKCGALLGDGEDPCELCGQRIDWSDE